MDFWLSSFFQICLVFCLYLPCQAKRSSVKLDIYRKFSNALLVTVTSSVVWIGYEVRLTINLFILCNITWTSCISNWNYCLISRKNWCSCFTVLYYIAAVEKKPQKKLKSPISTLIYSLFSSFLYFQSISPLHLGTGPVPLYFLFLTSGQVVKIE